MPILAFLGFILIIVGILTTISNKIENWSANSKLKKKALLNASDYDIKIINESKVYVGMSKEIAMGSWGRPNEIKRSFYYWGTTEFWIYDSNYLHFRNDVLISISSR